MTNPHLVTSLGSIVGAYIVIIAIWLEMVQTTKVPFYLPYGYFALGSSVLLMTIGGALTTENLVVSFYVAAYTLLFAGSSFSAYYVWDKFDLSPPNKEAFRTSRVDQFDVDDN